jgi:hypothetical protein
LLDGVQLTTCCLCAQPRIQTVDLLTMLRPCAALCVVPASAALRRAVACYAMP